MSIPKKVSAEESEIITNFKDEYFKLNPKDKEYVRTFLLRGEIFYNKNFMYQKNEHNNIIGKIENPQYRALIFPILKRCDIITSESKVDGTWHPTKKADIFRDNSTMSGILIEHDIIEAFKKEYKELSPKVQEHIKIFLLRGTQMKGLTRNGESEYTIIGIDNKNVLDKMANVLYKKTTLFPILKKYDILTKETTYDGCWFFSEKTQILINNHVILDILGIAHLNSKILNKKVDYAKEKKKNDLDSQIKNILKDAFNGGEENLSDLKSTSPKNSNSNIPKDPYKIINPNYFITPAKRKTAENWVRWNTIKFFTKDKFIINLTKTNEKTSGMLYYQLSKNKKIEVFSLIPIAYIINITSHTSKWYWSNDDHFENSWNFSNLSEFENIKKEYPWLKTNSISYDCIRPILFDMCDQLKCAHVMFYANKETNFASSGEIIPNLFVFGVKGTESKVSLDNSQSHVEYLKNMAKHLNSIESIKAYKKKLDDVQLHYDKFAPIIYEKLDEGGHGNHECDTCAHPEKYGGKKISYSANPSLKLVDPVKEMERKIKELESKNSILSGIKTNLFNNPIVNKVKNAFRGEVFTINHFNLTNAEKEAVPEFSDSFHSTGHVIYGNYLLRKTRKLNKISKLLFIGCGIVKFTELQKKFAQNKEAPIKWFLGSSVPEWGDSYLEVNSARESIKKWCTPIFDKYITSGVFRFVLDMLEIELQFVNNTQYEKILIVERFENNNRASALYSQNSSLAQLDQNSENGDMIVFQLLVYNDILLNDAEVRHFKLTPDIWKDTEIFHQRGLNILKKLEKRGDLKSEDEKNPDSADIIKILQEVEKCKKKETIIANISINSLVVSGIKEDFLPAFSGKIESLQLSSLSPGATGSLTSNSSDTNANLNEKKIKCNKEESIIGYCRGIKCNKKEIFDNDTCILVQCESKCQIMYHTKCIGENLNNCLTPDCNSKINLKTITNRVETDLKVCNSNNCSNKLFKEIDKHVYIQCVSGCKYYYHFSCWRDFNKSVTGICLLGCGNNINILVSRDGETEHNLLVQIQKQKPPTVSPKIVIKDKKNPAKKSDKKETDKKITKDLKIEKSEKVVVTKGTLSTQEVKNNPLFNIFEVLFINKFGYQFRIFPKALIQLIIDYSKLDVELTSNSLNLQPVVSLKPPKLPVETASNIPKTTRKKAPKNSVSLDEFNVLVEPQVEKPSNWITIARADVVDLKVDTQELPQKILPLLPERSSIDTIRSDRPVLEVGNSNIFSRVDTKHVQSVVNTNSNSGNESNISKPKVVRPSDFKPKDGGLKTLVPEVVRPSDFKPEVVRPSDFKPEAGRSSDFKPTNPVKIQIRLNPFAKAWTPKPKDPNLG